MNHYRSSAKALHSVTIGQVVQSYSFWGKGNQRPSYHQSSMMTLAQFVAHVGNDMLFHDVTEVTVQGYLRHRLEKVKPNTVRGEHGRVRAFFAWTVDNGFASYNVAALAKPPKEDRPLQRSTSEDEFMRLIAYTYDSEQEYRNRAILWLLHDTGMRIGELTALSMEDVDIDERIVRVHAESSKTHRSRRVPFNGDCAAALFDYLTFVREYEPGPLFLMGRGGHAPNAQALKQALRKLARRAGVSFGPHDLRRAFVDRCLAAGMAESLIQQLTGHESQEMIRRYGRTNADRTATDMYRKLMG